MKRKLLIAISLVITSTLLTGLIYDFSPEPSKSILVEVDGQGDRKLKEYDKTILPVEVTEQENSYILAHVDVLRNTGIEVERVVYANVPRFNTEDFTPKPIKYMLKMYDSELNNLIEEDDSLGYKVHTEVSDASTISENGYIVSKGKRYVTIKDNGDTSLVKIVSRDYFFGNRTKVKTQINIIVDNNDIKEQGNLFLTETINTVMNNEVSRLVESIKWSE